MGVLKVAFVVANSQTVELLADFFTSKFGELALVCSLHFGVKNIPKFFVKLEGAVWDHVLVADSFSFVIFVLFSLFLARVIPFIVIGLLCLAFLRLEEVGDLEGPHLDLPQKV